MAKGLVFKLLRKGVMYRFYRASGYPPKREALSLEITRRCIARCIMCNIWKTPHDTPELSLETLTGLLSSPVFTELKELDITGGEPFLRDDLTDLMKALCSLKAHNLKLLRSVAITTNGFLTGRILEAAGEFVPAMKEAGLDLIMAFAMDAIGPLHDEIRRVKGGWEKLDATIQSMKEIAKAQGNVIMGLKTTVLPVNVDHLEDIARYAEENGLFTIISPFILTENRYGNMDLEEQLHFSPADIEKMVAFYRSPRFLWSVHRDLLLRYLEKGEMAKPCSAGFNYFFVRSSGEVFPCPLIKESLGVFPDTPFEKLLASPQAAQFRRKVGAFRECRSCTEPGLERYALPFEGFHYLRMRLKMGQGAFLKLHTHMGLDKYT